MKRPFALFFNKHNIIKKLLLCIIIALISMNSISCGFKREDRSDNDDEKKEEVIITLWDFPRWEAENGSRFGWIEKKIKEFEKTHPGVYIYLKKLKWEYGMYEIRAACQAGINPDIAPVDGDYDLILKGYVEPVDEFFTREELSKYDERVLEALRVSGRLYGFPWFVTTYGIFVNKDLFEERKVNLPLENNWTFQDFINTAVKLTWDKNRDKKIDYYGFDFILKPGNYGFWGMLTMDGAKFFDEKGNFVLNTKEGLSALKKISEAFKQYNIFPPEAGDRDENRLWSNFAEKKKVAMTLIGNWAIPLLEKRKLDNKGFDYEMIFYPKGESQAHPIAVVSGYAILKQQDENKKKICAEFLKFITSEKEQENLIKYGVLPSIKNLQEKAALENEFLKKCKEILNSAEYLPKIANWPKIEEVINTEILLVIKGKKAPEKALQDMEKNILMISGSI
ncbi:MAG: ABC transporter substrate-binding protein [Thermovenabulum sp.]|uniref:ABC transporter substrate-binding protein n=1 Tax=Thermovenabulum sp. TaxID=3100335 RepID=UPI003C7D6D51